MRADALPSPRRLRLRRGRRGPGWRLYPRHRLDLRASDLGYALSSSVLAGRADRRERDLETRHGDGEAIVCFSLRSGFELLLDAAALAPRSEVLVSAITHPDMARIIERHGLVPVPVDVDPETLAPIPQLLEQAIGPKTRAVLVAHLFGARVDLEPTFRIAARYRLVVLEDCAQTFRGPGDRGDERADVSMFSFGSIKTCPALGGAILYVRRSQWLVRMRGLRAAWPRQPRSEYFARTLRFCALHALGNPWVYGVAVRTAERLGRDADAFVNGSVHALKPPGPDREDAFERWLRRRPSAALLAVLSYRLRSFDRRRLERRAAAGDELARVLADSRRHPGSAARERTHWVFPVIPDEPASLILALRRAGFDATRATTSIAAIAARPGSRAGDPQRARSLMDRVVFVPAYPELPSAARRRLATALSAADDPGGAA